MANYIYRCADCDLRFSVSKSLKDAVRVETCPECYSDDTDQDYGKKSVGGHISREGSWSEGKLVPQLHPRHPDRMVTSKRQMEQVYRKHGISLDTGQFESKEAQVAATCPRKLRRRDTSPPDNAVYGGVIDES